MSPRPVGNATISFGLVSIPVKLFSTSNPSSSISFRLLSKEGHRLKQQYVDPEDGEKVVPRDQMVKGYEFAKDKFVIFEPEEIKELQERSTETVDITEFVLEESVPRVFFEKTYYLGPDKGGERAYRLLAKAMQTTGRVALAKYAARGKQYLVLVAPIEDGLALHQLRYADEVVPFSEIVTGDAEIKDAELGLAVQLINQIAAERFQPEQYEDEVKKRIEAAIQQKIEGQAITIAAEEAPKGQIIDIMEALKQSLGFAGSSADPVPSESAAKTAKSSGSAG
ncbi:MAG: Ku protein [Deltaproteobacteria bacterium]|nr:Ku protein [Deltaproteobacteria bacterium]